MKPIQCLFCLRHDSFHPWKFDLGLLHSCHDYILILPSLTFTLGSVVTTAVLLSLSTNFIPHVLLLLLLFFLVLTIAVGCSLCTCAEDLLGNPCGFQVFISNLFLLSPLSCPVPALLCAGHHGLPKWRWMTLLKALSVWTAAWKLSAGSKFEQL